MPLPRFWYLPRGEKAVVVMSGDDHSPDNAPGRHRVRLRPLQGAEPGRAASSPTGSASARPRTSTRQRRSRTRRPRRTSPRASRSALHPVVASCPTTPISEASSPRSSTRSSARCRRKYTSVPAPVTSRTHCVFWPDWASNAKVELAHGIRMDAQLLPLPRALDRREARLHERRRLPDALRRPRRHADRRLPAEHEHDRRVDDRRYRRTIDALLDNALGPNGLLRRVRRQHAHRLPGAPPGRGGDRRVRAGARRAGDLLQAAARLDRRPRHSTIRGLNWNAGTLTFTTTVAAGATACRRCCPPEGRPAPSPRSRAAAQPVAYTVQTIKGIQYAVVRRPRARPTRRRTHSRYVEARVAGGAARPSCRREKSTT